MVTGEHHGLGDAGGFQFGQSSSGVLLDGVGNHQRTKIFFTVGTRQIDNRSDRVGGFEFDAEFGHQFFVSGQDGIAFDDGPDSLSGKLFHVSYDIPVDRKMELGFKGIPDRGGDGMC